MDNISRLYKGELPNSRKTRSVPINPFSPRCYSDCSITFNIIL